MPESQIVLSSVVISAVIAAIISGVFSIIVVNSRAKYDLKILNQNARNNLEADFKKELRIKRLELYKEFWESNELIYLPTFRFFPFQTVKKVAEITDFMSSFYPKLSLFLSDQSDMAFFDLRKALIKLVEGKLEGARLEISEDQTKEIREKIDKLRISLAEDVGTKKPLFD